MSRISFKINFGKFVKAKRMALGMSQKKLATIVFGSEMQQGYISKIEAGEQNITIDTIDAILEALKSNLDFLE